MATHALRRILFASATTCFFFGMVVGTTITEAATEPESLQAGDELSFLTSSPHPALVHQRLWGAQSTVEMMLLPGYQAAELAAHPDHQGSPLRNNPVPMVQTWTLPVKEAAWRALQAEESIPDRGPGFFDVPWLGGVDSRGTPYIFAGPDDDLRMVFDGRAHAAFRPIVYDFGPAGKFTVVPSKAVGMTVTPWIDDKVVVTIIASKLNDGKRIPAMYRFVVDPSLPSPALDADIHIESLNNPGADWALVDVDIRPEGDDQIVAGLYLKTDGTKAKVVWYRLHFGALGWSKINDHTVNKGSESDNLPNSVNPTIGRIVSPESDAFILQLQSPGGSTNYIIQQRNGRVQNVEGDLACQPVKNKAPLTLTAVPRAATTWVQKTQPVESTHHLTREAICFGITGGKLFAVENHVHSNSKEKHWANKRVEVASVPPGARAIVAAASAWMVGEIRAESLTTRTNAVVAASVILGSETRIFHRISHGESTFQINIDHPNGYSLDVSGVAQPWRSAAPGGGWWSNLWLTQPIHLLLEGTLRSAPTFDGGDPMPMVYFMPPPIRAEHGATIRPSLFLRL